MRTKSNESVEDYLEAILILSQKLPVVRSVDIANELGYKKPSVSIAMKNLREKDYIYVMEQGYIYLTDSGKEIAEMIYERHNFFKDWLISMGVDEKTAADDACKIEHDLSPESYAAIKKYFEDHKNMDNQ
ncbi:MAG: metal-dependent transcriptional regulator [Lachnospiraceae bacterium]|nr:metal-dependent transcriptional regulator [Lachnospiraceae bacterium]